MPSQWGKTGGDRHDVQACGDQVEGAARVEVVGEHQGCAVAQDAAEDGVQAVDVEERQHPEHDVAGADHRPASARRTAAVCSTLASRARWVSIAARGRSTVLPV